jgi:hypothetical protein
MPAGTMTLASLRSLAGSETHQLGPHPGRSLRSLPGYRG